MAFFDQEFKICPFEPSEIADAYARNEINSALSRLRKTRNIFCAWEVIGLCSRYSVPKPEPIEKFIEYYAGHCEYMARKRGKVVLSDIKNLVCDVEPGRKSKHSALNEYYNLRRSEDILTEVATLLEAPSLLTKHEVYKRVGEKFLCSAEAVRKTYAKRNRAVFDLEINRQGEWIAVDEEIINSVA